MFRADKICAESAPKHAPWKAGFRAVLAGGHQASVSRAGLCSNAPAFASANANAAFALAFAFDCHVMDAFALAFAFDSSAFALAFDLNAFYRMNCEANANQMTLYH